MVVTGAEVIAEVEQAAAENVAEGSWVAVTPLLDALSRALQDAAAPAMSDGPAGGYPTWLDRGRGGYELGHLP